jgi:hypothetical protein
MAHNPGRAVAASHGGRFSKETFTLAGGASARPSASSAFRFTILAGLCAERCLEACHGPLRVPLQVLFNLCNLAIAVNAPKG